MSTQVITFKFIEPEKIVSELDFAPGMSVADFGCGTGYFVFPLAKKVGETGTVFALDVLKDKLETVESQAKLSGINNIITKRVNLEKMKGSGLGEESVDWVVLVNMLFQNKDKKIILEETKRVLKPGGKVLIIEWTPQNNVFGPEERLKMDKDKLRELAKKAGLATEEEIEFNDMHYGLILRK